MQELKVKLVEFGLSDKEANVYLAMLELGPASVQEIAKKAGVNRATTYVMIEALKRRGLMSCVERGKKTFFSAESPEHLLGIVGDELRIIQEKKARLEILMPQFMGLFNSIDDKPKVRYFEGEEGVASCREAVQALAGEGHWRQFVHVDKKMAEYGEVWKKEREKLGTGKFSVRVLCAADEGVNPPVAGRNVEVRTIPLIHVPIFNGEFSIFDTFVVVATYRTRPIAVIIESEEITKLFQSFFELAWLGAKTG